MKSWSGNWTGSDATPATLLELLDVFKARGIKFSLLRDGIATDPASEMGAMVTIMPAFAQLERDQLSERTKAGMPVAASHGRKAGRREVPANHLYVKRAGVLKNRGLKPADISEIIRTSRATVYCYLSMEPV